MVAKEQSPSCTHRFVDVYGPRRNLRCRACQATRNTVSPECLPAGKTPESSTAYVPSKAHPKDKTSEPVIAGPSSAPKELPKRQHVDIDDIIDATSNISIRNPDEFCGIDVAPSSRMSVDHAGGQPNNWKVLVKQPNSNSVAVTIPIIRQGGQKAVALLVRGLEDPLKVAVSGWRSTSPRKYQLNCKEWVPKVLLMCEEIGHELQKSGFDQGIPGQFYACFPLKQLLAFLYFERPKTKTVKIHTTHPPSDDCVECLGLFEQETGMSIEVLVNGRRKWTSEA